KSSPSNIVQNQKYRILTSGPIVQYDQFTLFNVYFPLVTPSQLTTVLKIGLIFTYINPLAFVLCVTMGKEAYDDYKRNPRDRKAYPSSTTRSQLASCRPSKSSS
ncbi:hypothetical protein CONPUDRAFT_17473, partial [Coniophora puteana RWD-64-598 SS2]